MNAGRCCRTFRSCITLARLSIVLSVVVFVHEFGHFQVARWRNVAIDTFSIGFGKTLFGWRDKQGVQWKVGALPLGGYVKFADDADRDVDWARASASTIPRRWPKRARKGLFHAQGLTTRSLVVAAGPVTNFIFSILTFGALAFAFGARQHRHHENSRAHLIGRPNSAASAAGLQAHDIIRGVNGAPVAAYLHLQKIVIGFSWTPADARRSSATAT